MNKIRNENLKLISAPLAGVSDFAWRQMIRDFSPHATFYSEMISCYSLLIHHRKKTLTEQENIEPGIVAQIFGDDENKMAESARILEDMGALWIDINMGCPVKKVLSAGAGCAYLEDLPKAGRVIEAVKKAVLIPVSVKTRLGINEQKITIYDFLRTAENAGADLITIHGRTKAQMYSGNANWDMIKDVKSNAKIPVIGNGDIIDLPSYQSHKNDVDGIMIGRGLMGKPWLLKELEEGKMLDLTRKQIGEITLKHFDMIMNLYGTPGVKIFRKHASWYSFGMDGASSFRSQINNCSTKEDMVKLIKSFF